jgi:hypothetical protein
VYMVLCSQGEQTIKIIWACKTGKIIIFCGKNRNFSVCTSRHKLSTQHRICWSLLLKVIGAHHRVPGWPGGLGIVRIKSSQLLSWGHGVAGRGGSVGNARAKEGGEGVRVGGRIGIACMKTEL